MSRTNFSIFHLCTPGLTGENPSDLLDAINGYDPRKLAEQLRSLPYHDFLKTPYWAAVVAAKKKQSRWQCEECSERRELEIHHTSYEHHGYEHLWIEKDLACLCSHHHAKQHRLWCRALPKPRPSLKWPTITGPVSCAKTRK